MKVLVIGKSGQLANELVRNAPSNFELRAVGRAECDVTQNDSVIKLFESYQPDVVINASAYTAVDAAEADSETAFLVNRDGVNNIVQACIKCKARLIHVSTDFVFGNSSALTLDGIAPLQPSSLVDPVGAYGASKLAGEECIQSLVPDSSVIVRTAWVYSVYGNNFVKTMLRLMAVKPELSVIVDQIGTPTWAKGLADWLWAMVEKPEVAGVFHWTDAGVASWYDFAVAIQELALEKGLLSTSIPIKAIPTSSYPTPAKRPSYSVLDKSSAEKVSQINAVHWRKQLSTMLDQLKNESN